MVVTSFVLSSSGCAAEQHEPADETPHESPPSSNEPTKTAQEAPVTDPDEGIDFGDIPVTVAQRSSSRIELSWDAIADAQNIQIHLGPEPKGQHEQLPLERKVASLDGNATSYTLEGLAAGTDVFVRIVATTPRGDLWGIAHGRTLGGPRQKLDTPLRSVHAVAPNVLLLMLETREARYVDQRLEGARGQAWQGGQWNVTRADGADLGVRAVHRRSVPVGQPGYYVGWERWGSDNVVDIDDHLFLVLDEPIGERELLQVSHSGDQETDLDVLVPFSDRYLESPLIKINQVGYNPRATKRYAYLHGDLGDGGQVDLNALGSSAEVLADARNPLRPKRVVSSDLVIRARSAHDEEAGGPVHEIDLAALPAQEGARLRVRIPGVGVSFPTAVSEEAALKAFYVVARGLFLNRWCGDLDARYTDWSRSPDHCSAYFVEGRSYRDGVFPDATPKRNERPVLGGHHDAGDFDIRPFHVVVGQYLMRAFEANRGALLDNQLNIPESDNGIPDLLDEALYSIKGWEDLQNDNGSVRSGVESSHHPRGYYYADQDQLDYWTFDPEPWHTAYVAALFAQGSHLVRPYDPERANELLQRATNAFDWAQRNKAPAEFLLYAASELARATERATYQQAFESLWNDTLDGRLAGRQRTWAHIYPGSFDGNTPLLTDYVLGYTDVSGANQDIVRSVKGLLEDSAPAAARRLLDSEHAMRNGRPAQTPPDWGRSVTTALYADPIYQALTHGSPGPDEAQDYLDGLSLAADYVLGGNPAGLTYITGLGSVSPQEPLHTDSLSFIKDKGMPPMPGLPVYGPVNGLPGSPWYSPLREAFYPSFDKQPLGLRHVDSRTSVNTSEFTVWESQAPLAALFASLAPKRLPPRSWAAGGEEHQSGLPSHRVD